MFRISADIDGQTDVQHLNEKVTILGDRLLTLYEEIHNVFKILEDIKSTPILSPTTANILKHEKKEIKPNEELLTSSYIEIHENPN